MNNDRTVVILTPGFPKDEADSTCLPLQQNFLLALKNNYPLLNIVVLSFQYPFVTKAYQWNGITVIPFNGQNKGGLPKLLLRYKIDSALKKIYQQHSIAAILSFWYGECALMGKRFTNKYKIKNYCWLLGQDAKAGNKYPGNAALHANELIALSDFLQNEFERNYGIKPQHIIPPGVNTKEFEIRVQDKTIDILAAGSLIPLKQYNIFIAVIAAIKKQVPGIKAMLVGDGPEKIKLQALIAMNELEQNIVLTGELSHKETLQKMQQAKIFLHPSTYEGFGVVNIEALNAGCHVISFCKPMKQDLSHWYIVQNKEEMCKRSIDLLLNTNLKFESNCPFDINDTAKQMMNLFS